MPRKGYKSWKKPRRPWRKPRLAKLKRGQGPTTHLVLKRGIGFPDRFTSVLRYTETVPLDTANSGNTVGVTFRGNSLFDPRTAIGGQQPMYFDRFTGIYTHFMVWGSSITVRIINTENAQGGGNPANILVVYPSRQSTISSSIEQAIEQPRAKMRYFKDGTDHVYTIKSSARTRQMMPCGKQTFDRALSHEGGSNPADMWYWVIQQNSADGAAECVTTVQVTLHYYFTAYERKLEGRS